MRAIDVEAGKLDGQATYYVAYSPYHVYPFLTGSDMDTISYSTWKTIDLARGCILGALIGDAAGATLEFIGRRPTPCDVRTALRMGGGGVWQTAPGQITDDGELTLALCQALIGEETYRSARVARFYRRWYLSEPFDIGHATASALGDGLLDDPQLAERLGKNARRNNANSKANGSLMRASPLGVWASKVGLSAAVDAAREDARLTHPHPACQWSGAAYVIAIRHLMLNPGDHLGAFAAAEAVLVDDSAVEVLGWLGDAQSGRLPEFHPQAGFVRIAFTHAFYHLCQRTNYYEALSTILSGGGDTDTNACIAGGLLGALHGADGIPELMRSAVLNSDVTRGQPRPLWLQTQYVQSLIDALVTPESKDEEGT